MSSADVVVGLSGGLDSTTLLGFLLNDGLFKKVLCCTFDYGATHGFYEENASIQVIEYYQTKYPGQVQHHRMDISPIMKSFSSHLLAHNKKEIPEGPYSEENMKQTVVPGRNLIFASIMAGLAESVGARYVALGIHSGDHYVYPDCRPEFALAVREAVKQSSGGKVHVKTPFLYMNKSDIVELGLKLSVPFHLTRSCYKPQSLSCGKCGTCVERLEAFRALGREDPLKYDKGYT